MRFVDDSNYSGSFPVELITKYIMKKLTHSNMIIFTKNTSLYSYLVLYLLQGIYLNFQF